MKLSRKLPEAEFEIMKVVLVSGGSFSQTTFMISNSASGSFRDNFMIFLLSFIKYLKMKNSF